MKAPQGHDTQERFGPGGTIRFFRGDGSGVPRKPLLASELTTALQTACQESITSRRDNGLSYDLELAVPFLKDMGLADHVIIHEPRGKNLPRHPERSIYALTNLIVRRLIINLDDSLVGGTKADWEIMRWGLKLHFEHCRFIPRTPNMATISYPWRGSFRFYNNEFSFSGSGARSWLLAFPSMSDVTFNRNDFQESDIQVVSDRPRDDTSVQEVSWEGHSAYLLKDELYYKEMIRRTHRLPQSVRLTIPDSPYPGRHVGLGSLGLVGNRGIRRLLMRCSAMHYSFRGQNHIQSLSFNESQSDLEESTVYFGARERIDRNFRAPFHHRYLFLALREAAERKGDAALVNTLAAYVDRIEYFVTKEHRVSPRDGVKQWLEYWQDRIRHSWRRWSSDFYGSWIRPLALGILGYVGLNALAWIWIESFTVTDWIGFSLRRVDRIPFYTAGLSDLHPLDYDDLTATSKNWLRAIGLFQNVWIGMWGFAFGKAIRR